MNNPAPVTKQEFKKWLESKKSNTIVGIIPNSMSCPLAMFFLNKFNIPMRSNVYYRPIVKINSKDCRIGYDKQYDNKKWMINFIEKIDYSHHPRITAKKALDILKTC